eukprot:scaffold62632_cov21-Tisochrysis_lutea.AAC.2
MLGVFSLPHPGRSFSAVMLLQFLRHNWSGVVENSRNVPTNLVLSNHPHVCSSDIADTIAKEWGRWP